MPPPTSRQSISLLVAGRRARLVMLAMTALAVGLSEAAFLVLVARTGFAVTGGHHRVKVVGSVTFTVNVCLLIALGLVLVRLVVAIWSNKQQADLITDVVADQRRDLASAFLRASWATQQTDRAGKLQELLTTYVQQGGILITNLGTGIVSAFSLIALLGIAIAVDPLGAGVVVVTIAALSFVVRPLLRVVKGRARQLARMSMVFATSLSEVSQLGLEMHVFDVQDQTEQMVNARIDETTDADRRVLFTRGLMGPLYSTFAYLAVLGALAVVTASGSSNIGALGSVMLVMLRSLTYGQTLQNAAVNVVANLPFISGLQEQLDHYRLNRRATGGDPVGTVGTLTLDDVSFSYSEDEPVLRNLSLEIRPREIIGIVGPSGSGKSTLVQLLLGLRDADSGIISADGRPVVQLARSEWARKVTFVPQTAHLIAGTISDNIRFLRDGITQPEIERAAELAHLAPDVDGFPQGYDRQVGEQGGHLSGGQQQRLCIARALVERPDVLILDEPTSALDNRSEHLVRETLRTLGDQMTIVIIAHRLSTLDICDRIMVIQDGELKAFDTPENLARTNEFFNEALILSGMK